MESMKNPYKEIAEDYIHYLRGQSTTNNLTSWRNFFTGTFYRGKYARYMLRDMLAGGVKNNFLFGIFKKSDHANFIALIDRICKLDRNPVDFLRDEIVPAAQVQNQQALLNNLFEYFLNLQESAPEKNEIYCKEMKALKRDINHLAKEHNINNRIKKLEKEGVICYEIQYDPDNFDQAHESLKDKNRGIKTWAKRVAKFLASGMAIAEIFIGLAGFLTFHLAIPALGLTSLAVMVGLGSAAFGYIFAKSDLFKLCKDYLLGRLFKIKNPQTDSYEELGYYQKAALKAGIFFCVVAGFCIASLLFGSVPTVLKAYLGVAMMTTPLFVMTCALAAFVFLLITATFFETIKAVISQVNCEKIKNYFSALKRQDTEKIASYAPRITGEFLKWTICAFFMGAVASLGCVLFSNKVTQSLSPLLKAINAVKIVPFIAWTVAGSYSAIKFVFGLTKALNITNSLFSSIKSIKTWWNSDQKNNVVLNTIQQHERVAQSSYFFIGMSFLIFRSGAPAGFYREAGGTQFPDVPIAKDAAAACGFGYMASINSTPFLAGKKASQVEPLDVRKPALGAS